MIFLELEDMKTVKKYLKTRKIQEDGIPVKKDQKKKTVLKI